MFNDRPVLKEIETTSKITTTAPINSENNLLDIYQALVCSYAAATLSSVPSSKCRANNCNPIGSVS